MINGVGKGDATRGGWGLGGRGPGWAKWAGLINWGNVLSECQKYRESSERVPPSTTTVEFPWHGLFLWLST